ncbi:MAG: hypothetical protein J0G94_00850, partial [Sphingomonadales bacterium]|nr:hypothetical protein [Sphingomonadales bacterium]
IFNAPGGAKNDPARAELPTARVVVEVAVLAASADGNDEQAGLRCVLADIERLPNLTPAEQLRLSAYVYHLSRQEHAKASGWHRLASRPLGERERIAQVAVGALTADGRIEASEIKFAERLYSALGIPSERLYEDLHKQIGDEPRMVSPADLDGGGVIIPARPRGVSETLPPRSNGARFATGDCQQKAPAPDPSRDGPGARYPE